jgi:hypothetical protein
MHGDVSHAALGGQLLIVHPAPQELNILPAPSVSTHVFVTSQHSNTVQGTSVHGIVGSGSSFRVAPAPQELNILPAPSVSAHVFSTSQHSALEHGIVAHTDAERILLLIHPELHTKAVLPLLSSPSVSVQVLVLSQHRLFAAAFTLVRHGV